MDRSHGSHASRYILLCAFSLTEQAFDRQVELSQECNSQILPFKSDYDMEPMNDEERTVNDEKEKDLPGLMDIFKTRKSQETMEICQVRSNLFLGNRAAEAKPLSYLRQKGITAVVQLLGDSLDEMRFHKTHKGDLNYLTIEVDDSPREDLVRKLLDQKVFEFITKETQTGSVLVHCVKGISRSPATVVAYLMEKEDLLMREAFLQVYKARRKICPNDGFMGQLSDFEQSKTTGKPYEWNTKLVLGDDAIHKRASLRVYGTEGLDQKSQTRITGKGKDYEEQCNSCC